MEDLKIITNLNEPPKMVLLNCNYDLMKMCRTCNNECSESSISLFKYLKSDTDQIQIAEMLRESTALKVELGDGLPMIICLDCMKELIRVYHFIKKCKDTFVSMRQYIFNDENAKNFETKPVVSNLDLFNLNNDNDPQKIVNTVTNFSIKNAEIIFDNEDSKDNQMNNRNIDNKYVNHEEVFPESEPESELGYEVEEIDMHDDIDKMVEQKRKEDFLKKWHDKITRKNLLPCPHCMKCFQKEANLRDHIALHTGERLHKCQHCPRAYMTRSKLLKHHRDKHLETPVVYKCKKLDCLETFKTYKELREHVRNHVKNIWHCKECDQTFTYRLAFQKHQAMHNGVENTISETKCPCDICGKILKNRFNLNLHIKRHQKDYSYICDKCGKGYVDCKGLKIHAMTKHSDSGARKNYICEVCGKELSSTTALRHHRLAIHDRKPPSIPCPTCSKLFLTTNQMREHMKIHTREYKFTCEICDHKLFSQKELNIHKLKHTGERPFKCPKCPKAYRRQSMFQVHMKRHSKSLIQCDVCLSFLRPQFYEKHRAGHDNKKARDELKNENENSNTDAQES